MVIKEVGTTKVVAAMAEVKAAEDMEAATEAKVDITIKVSNAHSG